MEKGGECKGKEEKGEKEKRKEGESKGQISPFHSKEKDLPATSLKL